MSGGTLTLLARPRDLAEIAVHTRAGPENVLGSGDNSDEICALQFGKKVNGSEQVDVWPVIPS